MGRARVVDQALLFVEARQRNPMMRCSCVLLLSFDVCVALLSEKLIGD